jgi:hypothetical protein
MKRGCVLNAKIRSAALLRFQYGLRTLLLAFVVLSAVIAITIQWWTKPYVLTGTYPNGIRAWEQWNRRTLDWRLERIATIRYYRNGQQSYEYRLSTDQALFWTPDGKPTSSEEFWNHFTAEWPVPERDLDSQHPWPFD